MKPDRWQQIDKLFDASLERDPGQRAAFLDQACAGDEELRRELEALIAAHEQANSFLASPALEVAAQGIEQHQAQSLVGRSLGPYRILALLGAGGMGEVYKASDTRLNRTVAIKVLPQHVSGDQEFRQRFEREARTVASLSHPHICSVFDVGRQDGTDYLVMEYLDGETLSTRLQRGPLPLDQALHISIEVAEALDVAHRLGIVHRDLKPGNIMLTKSGAKLLDFGLARSEPRTISTPLSQDSTRETTLTQEGRIFGTLQYMAPEQLEGGKADARTDLFAFGSVVYETVTGKKAFQAESHASVIAAILEHDPPPLSTLEPLATPTLNRVVQKCLAKDPDRRWQSARDLADELKWIREGTPSAGLSTYGARHLVKRERLAWTVMGLAVGALLTVALLRSWPWAPLTAPPSRPTRRETIILPAAGRLALGNVLPGVVGHPTVAFSPDGSHLVYVVENGRNTRLFLRSMDEFEAAPIAGTEGAFQPFFSPDGQWIGFFTHGKLKKVSLRGGEPVIVCDATRVWGASWSTDGMIFFSPDEGSNLMRVSAEGGIPQVVAGRHRGFLWPDVLPGGQAVIFTRRAIGRQVELLVLATGERRVLIQAGAGARYVPTGHLVYVREGDLLAVPFDLARLEVTGPTVPILLGVRTELWGAGQFTFAGDGTLAYIAGTFAGKGTLVWVDRRGVIEPLPVNVQQYGYFSLSPDCRRVAVQISSTNTDVWLFDLARANWSRLTTEGNNIDPIWTPDGKRVVFASDRAGPVSFFWQFAEVNSSAELLLANKNAQYPFSWSPDGKLLAFVEFDPITGYDIGVLPIDGLRKPQPLLRTRFGEAFPAFSPDGRWIAFSSDESGRFETYVQRYPPTGERWQISTEGGAKPLWSPRGDELFYRSGSKYMVASIVLQPTFAAGKPQVFAEGPYVNVPGRSYDVDCDGRRLLVIREVEQPSTTEIRVVSNWFDELKRKVPKR